MRKFLYFFITIFISQIIYSDSDLLSPFINNLRLREAPKLNSKVIRILKENEILTLIEKGKMETIDQIKGNWVKVKTEKGEIGWCFDGYLLNYFYISEINLKIKYPRNYKITKSNEKNRRGSYLSYNFQNLEDNSLVNLLEIQFFTKESIMKFKDSFFGDKPTKERYTEQKNIYQNPKPENFYVDNESKYDKFNKLIKVSDRYFFLNIDHFKPGGVFLAEYTFFINDYKIDILLSILEEKFLNNNDFINRCNEIINKIII